MDPDLVGQNMGPELLAGSAGRTSVGAFLPLCPRLMLGPETLASIRLKKGYPVIDGTGSHQKWGLQTS